MGKQTSSNILLTLTRYLAALLKILSFVLGLGQTYKRASNFWCDWSNDALELRLLMWCFLLAVLQHLPCCFCRLDPLNIVHLFPILWNDLIWKSFKWCKKSSSHCAAWQYRASVASVWLQLAVAQLSWCHVQELGLAFCRDSCNATSSILWERDPGRGKRNFSWLFSFAMIPISHFIGFEDMSTNST